MSLYDNPEGYEYLQKKLKEQANRSNSLSPTLDIKKFLSENPTDFNDFKNKYLDYDVIIDPTKSIDHYKEGNIFRVVTLNGNKLEVSGKITLKSTQYFLGVADRLFSEKEQKFVIEDKRQNIKIYINKYTLLPANIILLKKKGFRRRYNFFSNKNHYEQAGKIGGTKRRKRMRKSRKKY